jgi:hypothetical protein
MANSFSGELIGSSLINYAWSGLSGQVSPQESQIPDVKQFRSEAFSEQSLIMVRYNSRGLPIFFAGNQAGSQQSEYTVNTPSVDRRKGEPLVRRLKQHYIVANEDSLAPLLQEHRHLCAMLLEAVPHLHQCFGDSLLQLRASADDEDVVVVVSVVWSKDLAGAQEALEAFDEEWWLEKCAGANGYLVFDFEMMNVV